MPVQVRNQQLIDLLKQDFITHDSHTDLHAEDLVPHDIIASHTGTGSEFDVIGFTASNTLGILTPSAAPGAAESLLKTTAAGLLTLQNIDIVSTVTAGSVTIDSGAAQTDNFSTGSTGWQIPYSGDAEFRVVTADSITLESGGTINSGNFGTDNFVSQLTGWRIDYDGSADFREIFADELHVRAFIADIEQALAGGQIVSKSVSLITRDFVVPFQGDIVFVNPFSDFVSVSGDQTGVIEDGQDFSIAESTANNGLYTVDNTVYNAPNTEIYVTGTIHDATVDGEVRFRRQIFVEDLPGFPSTAAFSTNDWLRLRVVDRSGGGLSVSDSWGTVSSYTDEGGGEQSWVFTTRDDGGSAGETVYAGAIVLDYGSSGDGYWEVTALGNDVPYSQIVTWSTDPSVSGNHTLRSRLGNLDGVTDSDFPGLGGWGLYSDNAFLAGALKVLDDSFFAGVVTIDTNGEIRQGTGTLGSNFTGLRVWNDSSVGRIGGYNSDTLQWYGDTDGKLYAGGGSAILDEDGITILTSSSGIGFDVDRSISFGSPTRNSFIEHFVGAGDDTLYIRKVDTSSVGGIDLDARANSGGTGRVSLRAQEGSNTVDVVIQANNISSLYEVDISGGDLVVDTDTLFVDASTSRVGIGTASPVAPLTVSGAAGSTVGNGERIRLGGANGDATFHVQGGHGRFAIAWNAYYDNVAGQWEYAAADPAALIGFSNTPGAGTGSGNVHITGAASGTAGNAITWANGLTVRDTGRVGIGTTINPSFTLDVVDDISGGGYVARIFNDGNAANRHVLWLQGGQDSNPSNAFVAFVDGNGDGVGSVSGDGSGGTDYNTTSDIRVKEDIRDLAGPLGVVAQLRPITYRGVGADPGSRRRHGLVAQEVRAVVPELVNEGSNGLLSMDYGRMVPALIGAIKELKERIETLEEAR